ncbi:MAG: ATP-binding protein [Verrucomicrobiota bacterium]|nr:ATP-binding protein [Verrucomicrobiota bacterium]
MNYLLPIKRLFKLITTSSIDHEQHSQRLKLMERDIGVPVKLAVLLITAFFLLRWKELWPSHAEVEEAFHNPVKMLFIGYAIVNVGAILFFILFNKWQLRVVHWFTVLMNVVDAAVISGLVVITGGIDSAVYWVFLVLVVRNAISIPIAVTQVMVNLMTVGCYVVSILIWFDYVLPNQQNAANIPEEVWRRTYTPSGQFPSNKFNWERPLAVPGASTNTEAVLSGTNKAPSSVVGMDASDRYELQMEEERLAGSLFTIRVWFLLLWTALCYGVQVLFDRDREAQREAREYALRREQLRSTGRLAAEIAHRLKNPLSIINNSAYTLDRNLQERDDDSLTKQVSMIRDEVARSDLILTELMGYAKLSEGRVEKLNFREELKQAMVEVFPDHAEFEVKARTKIVGDLPALMMQRGHLREILLNLLVNAREASGKDAQVVVNAHTTADFSIELRIKDEGDGILADHMERIYEAYFSTKEKGTGLGLAIVKQNVELYGGAIEVESELGQGAEFIVTLPTRALQQT